MSFRSSAPALEGRKVLGDLRTRQMSSWPEARSERRACGIAPPIPLLAGTTPSNTPWFLKKAVRTLLNSPYH